METQGEKSKAQKLFHNNDLLLKVPWLGIIDLLWSLAQRITELFQPEGLYEVLDYETTLEIHDRQGKKATVNKRQKVRYLKNHIIAYQDQAWGDEEILINYKCTPGVPVDRYQFGHKTIILISLREEKNKDDIDEFRIIWKMKNSLTKEIESWETAILHKTKRVTVNIIFPAARPPLQIFLIEGKNRKPHQLKVNTLRQLPDGRWQVTWQRFKPKVHEEYLLQWQW